MTLSGEKCKKAVGAADGFFASLSEGIGPGRLAFEKSNMRGDGTATPGQT